MIHPIETETFRAPPDRDDNGKILLLGLDGGEGYAGYFNPINTLSPAEAAQFDVNTNAMEIVDFNVTIGPYFGFDPSSWADRWCNGSTPTTPSMRRLMCFGRTPLGTRIGWWLLAALSHRRSSVVGRCASSANWAGRSARCSSAS